MENRSFSSLLRGYDFASLPVFARFYTPKESSAPVACGHSCYKTQVFKLRSSKFRVRALARLFVSENAMNRAL